MQIFCLFLQKVILLGGKQEKQEPKSGQLSAAPIVNAEVQVPEPLISSLDGIWATPSCVQAESRLHCMGWQHPLPHLTRLRDSGLLMGICFQARVLDLSFAGPGLGLVLLHMTRTQTGAWHVAGQKKMNEIKAGRLESRKERKKKYRKEGGLQKPGLK